MEKLLTLVLATGLCCLLLHREGLMGSRGDGRSFTLFLLFLTIGARCFFMNRIPSVSEDAAREAVTYFHRAGGFWGVRSSTGPWGLGLQYLLSVCGLISPGYFLFRLLNLFADVLIALGCSRCVSAVSVRPGPRLTVFLLVMLLPSGIIDSAAGMREALPWLIPVLASAAVLRGRFYLTGVLLGVGITLDPGILWLIPVFWVFPAVRENSGRTIVCLLGAYGVAVLPALLLGRPPEAVFPFYPGISALLARKASGGAPGLYALSPLTSQVAGIAAYGILAALTIYRLSGRDAIRDRRRQFTALCFAALASGSLLPGMPAPVLFGAEALLIALCALEPEAIPATVLTCAASSMAVIQEAFPGILSAPMFWSSAAVFFALFLLGGMVLFRKR